MTREYPRRTWDAEAAARARAAGERLPEIGARLVTAMRRLRLRMVVTAAAGAIVRGDEPAARLYLDKVKPGERGELADLAAGRAAKPGPALRPETVAAIERVAELTAAATVAVLAARATPAIVNQVSY